MSAAPDYRSQEWLDERRSGLGASDVAAIVGLSPWKSPYALWVEKTGLAEDTQDETDNMEFGRRVEPVLARWFEDRTGLKALGEQTMCNHLERPWMRCTLDGFVGESDDTSLADALGGLEIKTTSDAAERWADEMPDHYRCQGQWIMAVTGFDRLWFPTLHFAFGRREFKVHELERDDQDIKFLIAEAEKFWVDNVLANVPPEVDGSEATKRALKTWTATKGVEVDLAEMAETVEAWKLAKADLKAIEDAIDEYENTIKAALEHATEGTLNGQTVVSWRARKFSRVDAKALRDAHPDIAEAFTNTSEQRVLLAHTPKGKN